MSQFSKDELSFVNKLPEHVEIECPVCLNILANPHLVSCCGHNFCEDCIERVKASNGACPMCQERDFQAMVNKGHLRIINGLQVYCANKENGCKCKGKFKDLSTHLNKGKREGECQYEEVKCRYEKCEERKQRQDLNHHEAKECPQRPFKCQYCNARGIYHSITKKHYKKCLQYPVRCPNQCTLTQMPRGSVTDHVNNECPLQPVDCVFSWAGCKERPLRKDIELHTTDTKHMMILAVACGELKKENEKMQDQIVSLHHVAANDSYPILPITVTPESGVVHFYSGACGHHMSVRLLIVNITISTHDVTQNSVLYCAFHSGKFDTFKPNIPQIYAKCGSSIKPLIEDTEATYQQAKSDVLENVSYFHTTPPGVLKRQMVIYSSKVDVHIYIK